MALPPFRILAIALAAHGYACRDRDTGGIRAEADECLRDCVATTTTIAIVQDGASFVEGDTITFEATVTPAPSNDQEGVVFFYATEPVHAGAGVEVVVDGIARRAYACGSAQIPRGSHRAQAQFNGTSRQEGSVSTQIAYECRVP